MGRTPAVRRVEFVVSVSLVAAATILGWSAAASARAAKTFDLTTASIADMGAAFEAGR